MSESTTTMKINAHQIIQLRNERAWSQHHLAEVCGLSLRTIQRVEKESRASQETVKAIASIFELQPGDLILTEASEVPLQKDVDHSKSAKKHYRFKTKLLVSASAFLALLSAVFWVPMTSATGIEVLADTAIVNEDASETFVGNVCINIPSGYNTEIGGATMWSAGETSFFKDDVYVVVELNGQRYQMQNAVVRETESGISISTDMATLMRDE